MTARHPCEPGAPPASPRVRVVDRERLSPALAAGAADEAAGRALGAALEAALGRLVALYPDVMMLRVRQGTTAKEIGEVLGGAAGTVRTQVVRGMERLRRLQPPAPSAFTAATGADAPMRRSRCIVSLRQTCMIGSRRRRSVARHVEINSRTRRGAR